MASFFHSYDLRGKYPDEIEPEEAKKVGKAYGSYLESKEVLVGRDGRRHGEEITEKFMEGLRSTGTDVIYLGMAHSPLIYFGVEYLDLDGGAVVTASHNPPEYTGFKFCKQKALAMSREGGMREIEKIYDSEEFQETDEEGETRKKDLKEEYINFVAEKINLEEKQKVAINYGNGVSSLIGRELFERIGCEVIELNNKIDGDFPSHLPAPGEKEAQTQLKSIMDDEDLGIIFDGDGDRAGFILPEYGYIEEDKVLAVFSEKILDQKSGTVIHDLRSSKLVPEIVRGNKGVPKEMRVGHTFFSEEIFRDDSVVFGGELSGHYYFPGLGVPWDDGVFTAALMCEISSETDLKEKLESYPEYPVSPELRIDCPEESKDRVIEKMKEEYSDHEKETVDGVKIYFDRGWTLVRPSSTEEKMSVRCEADTEEFLDEILEEVEENVREFISSSS